ncbi:MAG TPA: GAF domain-containing protein, partial [Candidatus Binatia bacterium]|nr:GAF domain-containing protein [Candidatus Binatia bacterium]
MSAQPDRHAVDDRPGHGSAVSGVLMSARRSAGGALSRRSRGNSAAPAGEGHGLLGGGAPATLPVPSAALALGALGAYAIVVIGASGIVGVGLASIPLFIAAALLPARSAVATGLATIALTLIPAIIGDTPTVAVLAMVAELTLLVTAALALRAAVVRLEVSRAARAEQVEAADEQLQDRVRTVLAIAERMTRTFDQAEIFETVVAETQRVLGADGVTIRIVRDELLQVVAWAGVSADVANRLPTARPGEWWFSEAVRAGRAWVGDDIAATLRGPTRRLYDAHAAILPFAADLVVPLYGHDRVMGAISVLRTQPYHWQTSDIEFVAALATHASIAISNAELYERAETRALLMSVLQAASGRMSRENTIESVGRAIVEETRGIIDYHNARVYVLEPPDTLEPIAF